MIAEECVFMGLQPEAPESLFYPFRVAVWLKKINTIVALIFKKLFKIIDKI